MASYESFLEKNYLLINIIYIKEIILYSHKYILIAFSTQLSEEHFVAYFKNLNGYLKLSLNNWFRYDDMKGVYKRLNNIEFSLNDIKIRFIYYNLLKMLVKFKIILLFNFFK